MNGICRLALVIWLLSATFAPAADDGVIGTWKTADGRALIDIYQCGDKICGRVAWLREPCFPAGREPTGTTLNPNCVAAVCSACRSWRGSPAMATIVGAGEPYTIRIRDEATNQD